MSERYGNRRIDRMLREWNEHRQAVASGDMVRAQETFDACEQWIDFAFGRSTPKSSDHSLRDECRTMHST